MRKLLSKNRYVVFKLPINWTPQVQDSSNNFTIAEANPELIKLLFEDDPVRYKTFLGFLKTGMKGLIHYKGGQWASYAWMSCPGTPGPNHLPFVRKLGVYWIHYCRTKEEFQNQGLYKQSLVKLCEMARNENPVSEVFIDTEPDNFPSIKAIQRVGFQPDGSIETLSINIPKFRFIKLIKWSKNKEKEKGTGDNE